MPPSLKISFHLLLPVFCSHPPHLPHPSTLPPDPQVKELLGEARRRVRELATVAEPAAAAAAGAAAAELGLGPAGGASGAEALGGVGRAIDDGLARGANGAPWAKGGGAQG